MRILFLCAAISALLYNCNSDPGLDVSSSEPLTDVLTLELSFGDKDLPDEYLLANPTGITVNEKGEILISDEYKVKVFDADGHEKKIFGGQGQGPGEFLGSASNLTIGPSGYLTVKDVLQYLVFDGDFNYKRSIHRTKNVELANFIRSNNLTRLSLKKSYSISDSQFLIHLEGHDTNIKNEYPGYDFLLHLDEESVVELISYNQKDVKRFGTEIFPLPFEGGSFLYDIVDDKRFVYTRTDIDQELREERHYYILRLSSWIDDSESILKKEYRPIEISDERKDSQKRLFIRFSQNSPDLKSSIDKIIDGIDDKKYWAPLRSLKTDGKYIFVFTRSQNSNEEILADIFNANTEEYISSAYFAFIPMVIKNEHAYRITKNEDGFAVVEKYKIDPAVYGK